MKTLREIGVQIFSSLIAAIILMYLFYPDIYSKGISNINWLLFGKILLVVFTVAAWMQFTIRYKIIEVTKNLNIRNRDHFYTIDEDERLNAIEKFGYTNEKIACYVFTEEMGKQKGAVPLYRLLSRL